MQGYFLWLALCALVGLFGLMSLIVATFEAVHTEQQNASKLKRTQDRYRLLAPTFILWTAFTSDANHANDQGDTEYDPNDPTCISSSQQSPQKERSSPQFGARGLHRSRSRAWADTAMHVLHRDQFSRLVIKCSQLGEPPPHPLRNL